VALARAIERRLGRVRAGLARRDTTVDFRLRLAETHRRLHAMEPDIEAEVDAAVFREVTELCGRAFDPRPLRAEELESLRARVDALLGRLVPEDGPEELPEGAGSARPSS
jgi:hypothetical protein